MPAERRDGPAFAAEVRLLLACARVAPGQAEVGRIAAAATAELNWPLVQRLAHVHGVIPLLHRNVAHAARGAVPEPVAAELRRRAAEIARRNLLLTAALAETLRLLDAAGIPAVPFKGPLLAERLYGDLGLRPFRDVDVLVRRSDVAAAAAALARAGFSRSPARSDRALAARLRSAWVSDLEMARGDAVVELHWRLTPGCFGVADALDDVSIRLASATLAGSPVRTLSDAELLLYLCIHGATHRWGRIEWICDVAMLLRSDPRIDWEALAVRAAGAGATRMLALGLHLAHELLGAPLPAGIPVALDRDRAVARLATDVTAELADPAPDPNPGLKLAPFHLRMRERLRDRARYAAAIVLQPSPLDLEAVSLPPNLYPLYYVIRPFRLLAPRLARRGRPAASPPAGE